MSEEAEPLSPTLLRRAGQLPARQRQAEPRALNQHRARHLSKPSLSRASRASLVTLEPPEPAKLPGPLGTLPTGLAHRVLSGAGALLESTFLVSISSAKCSSSSREGGRDAEIKLAHGLFSQAWRDGKVLREQERVLSRLLEGAGDGISPSPGTLHCSVWLTFNFPLALPQFFQPEAYGKREQCSLKACPARP